MRRRSHIKPSIAYLECGISKSLLGRLQAKAESGGPPVDQQIMQTLGVSVDTVKRALDEVTITTVRRLVPRKVS